MSLSTIEPDLSNVPDVNDDLDDLFRPMQASLTTETTTNNRKTTSTTSLPKRPHPSARNDEGNDDLGINSAIQITKKRKPIAKLDEDRILSQSGIPKLRRLRESRMKFRGKGHEFSDIARLLNIYQLWLDDLYPRAKFADGLVMIEKLGHGKRMGVMRREWMKEGTGGKREKRKKDATEVEHVRRKGDKVVVEESLFVGPTAEEEDMEDLLRDDAGDDDELDALLMEEPILRTEHVAPVEDVSQPELEAVGEGLEDQYAEEMRVMAEMEDW